MPWKVSDPVKERTKFVLKWEERFELAQGGRVNVSELCRMFGVSRQTSHDWLKRYRKARSLDALVDRSSVRHNSPPKVRASRNRTAGSNAFIAPSNKSSARPRRTCAHSSAHSTTGGRTTTTCDRTRRSEMRVPADAYQRASRRYPCKLVDSRNFVMERDELYRLDNHRPLKWKTHKILVSSALRYEYVLVERAADNWTHLSSCSAAFGSGRSTPSASIVGYTFLVVDD
jgi:hypothetical protein